MAATIVIPNYNGIKYIDACLESVYAGTVIPKVIVVDNGSCDGSIELVEEKYPQARAIRFEDNKGFCTAVNAGIKAADTEYVILLNNDTQVERHFTEALEAAIRKRKDAFSVSAKMLSMKEPELIDGAGDLYCALGWAFSIGKGKDRKSFGKEAEIFASCAGAAIYRKEIFDSIGYFDENHFAYLEDIDIGYRAKTAGYRNYFSPEAVVYHAGSGVSGSRYNEFKVKLSSRNSIYLVYKNMPFVQIVLNLPFLIPGFFVKFLFFIKKGLGKTYFLGLMEGFKLSLSGKGREKKVKFKLKNLVNYMKIQLELWINLLRRIIG
ncbi:MAG: glycosyltransferase family 2 protein [Clostridiales bacterium]|nr:glycosyltransferase family 2 protein [Clostridiales bacterium]